MGVHGRRPQEPEEEGEAIQNSPQKSVRSARSGGMCLLGVWSLQDRGTLFDHLRLSRKVWYDKWTISMQHHLLLRVDFLRLHLRSSPLRPVPAAQSVLCAIIRPLSVTGQVRREGGHVAAQRRGIALQQQQLCRAILHFDVSSRSLRC